MSITLPYALTGGFDELATRFGDIYNTAPDGPIKDTALLCARGCMRIVQENGSLWWNENRTFIVDATSALQATTPNPGGFIIPQGTALATKAHYARTWARFLRRVDVGDNSYLLEALTVLAAWAYWVALWDNNQNGIDEILVNA